MKYGLLKKLAVFILILAVFSQSIGHLNAAVAINFDVAVDKLSAAPGETITYTVRYSNPNIDSPLAAGETLTVQIPENMTYIATPIQGDVDTITPSSDGKTITYVFNALSDGDSGYFKLQTKFPEGTTYRGASGTLIINDLSAEAVTAVVGDTLLEVEKTKSFPSVDPAVGANVTYQITVRATSGGVNLKDVQVEDTLPTNAHFVSASNGGTYENGQVVWQIDSLNSGASKTLSLVVAYRDNDGFDSGDKPNNTVTVVGTEDDPSTQTPRQLPSDSDSVEITLAAPNPALFDLVKSSRQANDAYAIGQTLKFFLSEFGNGGNVDLDSMTVSDHIPAEMTLEQLDIGSYVLADDTTLTVNYKAHSRVEDTWTIWAGPFGITSGAVLEIEDLSLAPGDFIEDIQLNYENLPVGFRVSSPVVLSGRLNAMENGTVDPDGNPVPVVLGTQVDNTALFSGEYQDNPIAGGFDDETITVADPLPYILVDKSVSAARANVSDTLTYTITISNHQYATGSLENAELDLTDVLPGCFENYQLSDAPVNTVETGTATKQWTISDVDLEPGESIELIYEVDVKANATSASYANSVEMTVDQPINGSKSDLEDSVSIFVEFYGKLKSEKLVKGDLDLDFSKYPNSTTLSGGPATYRLEVENTESNGPISNIVIIDKLPAIGDRGVVSSQLRLTEWIPYMVTTQVTGLDGGVLPAQLKVYYSTSDAPSLGQLNDPLNHTDYNAGWTLVSDAPENLDVTQIKALKFDFNDYALADGESVYLEWKMRAPFGVPSDGNLIAWNSFGYSATYPDENGPAPFLASEPIKVGIKVGELPEGTIRHSIGNYFWEDRDMDGTQETGEPGINNIVVHLYKDYNGDGDVGDSSVTIGDSTYNETVPYDTTRTGNSFGTTSSIGAAGYYLFTNLTDGQYSVGFEMPSDEDGQIYYLSPNDLGENDALDSDFIKLGSVYRSNLIGINSPTVIIDEVNLDGGLYRPASIGNLVWNDTDQDGIQDSGESGLDGFTMMIYGADGTSPVFDAEGSAVGPVSTISSGQYLMDLLMPGQYVLKLEMTAEQAAAYMVSPENRTTDDKDSDVLFESGNAYKTAQITLESNETDLTWDAGVHKAYLGDRVWHDKNANGLQDDSYSNISGVRVNLYKFNGATYDYQSYKTTDANGNYFFDDLDAGTYKLEFIKPAAYDRFTFDLNAIGLDLTDSDAAASEDGSTAVIEGIELSVGEKDITNDCGLFNYAAIGDFVFNDLNHDGIKNTGFKGTADPGIGGVSVTINGTQGNGLAYTSTMATSSVAATLGQYKFSNLIPGSYVLTFGTSEGFIRTGENKGINDNLDSDANVSTGATGSYTLASYTQGYTVTSVDAGLYRGRLGNYIWEDMNYNGNQSDESGKSVSGVTLELIDLNSVLLDTAVTDSNGFYYFENLPAGDYRVRMALPTGYELTIANADSISEVYNSDFDPSTLISDVVSLAVGGENYDLDGGLFKKASLGNLIWYDQDQDGIKDSSENAISGLDVALYKNGSLLRTTVTTANAGANYLFTNLVPGTYHIKVLDPEGKYKISPQTAAITNERSSLYELGAQAYESAATTLASGQNFTDLDGGLYKGELGGLAWYDVDLDGHRDEAENQRVAGIQVELIKDAAVLETTLTDGSGSYAFYNLDPGNYSVCFTTDVLAEDGYDTYTYQNNELESDTLDSDADYGARRDSKTGLINGIHLIAGERDYTNDAGFNRYASIGDYVWEDVDYDGRQDETEPGINDVTVRLLDGDGNPVLDVDGQAMVMATQTKDGVDGWYSFEGVIAGEGYRVKFDMPTGFDGFTKHNEVGDTQDSDADADGLTGLVSVGDHASETSVDAGLYRFASLGDFFFYDDNLDGRHNYVSEADKENPVAGVELALYMKNEEEEFVDTTRRDTTDVFGKYLFDDLIPGDYYVKVLQLPVGYLLTDPYVDGDMDASGDSNFTQSAMKTDPYRLDSNEDNLTLDGGIYASNSLGDRIWLDWNANGQQDDDEPGVADATVALYRLAGSSQIKVGEMDTDATGNYLFEELFSGSYTVRIELPEGYYLTVPDQAGIGDDKDSDFDRETLSTPSVDLTSHTHLRHLDGGIYSRVSVGDYAWLDYDGDGIQDDYIDVNKNGIEDVGENLEMPIRGIAIMLTDALGQSATDIDGTAQDPMETDADGRYIFDSLIPGTYRIGFNAQTPDESFFGWNIFLVTGKMLHLTGKHAGAVPGELDSDSNRTTNAIGTTDSFELEDQGELKNRRDQDAGFYQLGSIGNKIFMDYNRDGIQDADEKGADKIKVILEDANGVKTETVTDAQGAYKFDDLQPGTYTLSIEIPSSHHVTYDHRGTDDALDSDLNPDSGATPEIDLYSGQDLDTIDGGIYYAPPAAAPRGELGDLIWLDANGNGKKEALENGIAGIDVYLYDVNDKEIDETTTDQEGYYLFTDLEAGSYTVKVETDQVEKYEQTYDLDGKMDHETGAKFAAAERNLKLDFGYMALNVPTTSPTRLPTAVLTPTTPTPTGAVQSETDATPSPEIKQIFVIKPTEADNNTKVFVPSVPVKEIEIIKEAQQGTVTVNEDDEIIYTPDEDTDGTDSFVVRITTEDGEILEEVIDIFEEATPEGAPTISAFIEALENLPNTGGIPVALFYSTGTLLVFAGYRLRRR